MRVLTLSVAPMLFVAITRLWGAISTLRLRADILRDEFREEAPPARHYRLSRVVPQHLTQEAMVGAGNRLGRDFE
jgi:hypothetical protein